jgi:hypothetical protein
MKTDPSDYECLDVPKASITRMGYSVRVEDARYTEWRVWLPSLRADWTAAGLVAQELYGFCSSFVSIRHHTSACQNNERALVTMKKVLVPGTRLKNSAKEVVRACVRVCVRACVRVCVRACVRARAACRYDHTGNTGRGPASMDGFEYDNLAYDPARAADVARLAAVIRQHFDHDKP